MDLIAQYAAFTHYAAHWHAVGDKFLHMAGGLTIWLAVALVLRRPLFSRWPLIAIVAIQLSNEMVDYIHDGPLWGPWDTLFDCLTTWLFPFLIAALLHWMPWLAEPTSRAAKQTAGDPEE
jgi:hypothetical protein